MFTFQYSNHLNFSSWLLFIGVNQIAILHWVTKGGGVRGPHSFYAVVIYEQPLICKLSHLPPFLQVESGGLLSRLVSLLLVFLQLYPQYRALRIIAMRGVMSSSSSCLPAFLPAFLPQPLAF